MSKRGTRIQATLSLIGIILGISASIVFNYYGNIHAVFWSFLSAVFASTVFQLHVLHLRDLLEDWHNLATLTGIKFLGFATSIVSFAAMTWYIFCWLYYKIPMMPVKDSMVIAAVWAFMTFKWGLILHAVARRYSRLVAPPEASPLLTS